MTRTKQRVYYLQEFGARLATLRQARGMSQEQLAAQTHLSRETISKLERGRVFAHIETLHELAKAFGIPTSELFTDLAQDVPKGFTL